VVLGWLVPLRQRIVMMLAVEGRAARLVAQAPEPPVSGDCQADCQNGGRWRFSS